MEENKNGLSSLQKLVEDAERRRKEQMRMPTVSTKKGTNNDEEHVNSSRDFPFNNKEKERGE